MPVFCLSNRGAWARDEVGKNRYFIKTTISAKRYLRHLKQLAFFIIKEHFCSDIGMDALACLQGRADPVARGHV
jgi:hypothetical protein